MIIFLIKSKAFLLTKLKIFVTLRVIANQSSVLKVKISKKSGVLTQSLTKFCQNWSGFPYFPYLFINSWDNELTNFFILLEPFHLAFSKLEARWKASKSQFIIIQANRSSQAIDQAAYLLQYFLSCIYEHYKNIMEWIGWGWKTFPLFNHPGHLSCAWYKWPPQKVILSMKKLKRKIL